ncbi:hypothetical protein IWW55_005064 [Coemansia sp. RSA 2706]|nr:hypothetical protein IWW55_005064 [Coemansia sp. RSA 2706]
MKLSIAALLLALSPAIVQPAAAQVASNRAHFSGSASLSYQDVQKLVNNDNQAHGQFWDAITHYDSSVNILAKIKSAAPDAYNKHLKARNAMRSAFELAKQAQASLKV